MNEVVHRRSLVLLGIFMKLGCKSPRESHQSGSQGQSGRKIMKRQIRGAKVTIVGKMVIDHVFLRPIPASPNLYYRILIFTKMFDMTRFPEKIRKKSEFCIWVDITKTVAAYSILEVENTTRVYPSPKLAELAWRALGFHRL